jgi:hypothetical protein
LGAREVLDIATRGGAACLGRSGELGELALGGVEQKLREHAVAAARIQGV